MRQRFPVNIEINLSDEFGGKVFAEQSERGKYTVMQKDEFIASGVPYATLEKIMDNAATDPQRAQGSLAILAYRGM